MVLQVIGTGSKGNCYILRAGSRSNEQSLILDAGIPFTRIMREAVGWETVVGCLITHEHQDHAKSAENISVLGIPTYATQGTIHAIAGDRETTMIPVKSLEPITIQGFTVMPFETRHDAAEPCGYLIRHEATGETAVYATDTYYLPYTFPNVDFWIIECNYIEGRLKEQLESGEISEQLAHRLQRSHMSLGRLIDALNANDTDSVAAIALIHLSDERSDEEMIEAAMKTIAPYAEVYIVEDGCSYILMKTPF